MLAWALAAELERRGGLDRAFIKRHVEGFEEYMKLAREWPLERAAPVTGLSAGALRTFADWYLAFSPAAISVGNGLESKQNDGGGIRAIVARAERAA